MSAVYHDYIPLFLEPVDGDTGVTQAASTQARILSAAADIAWVGVPYKGEIRFVHVLFTDTNATGGTYTFTKRVLAGSDTGAATIAVITKPAADNQGKLYYKVPAVGLGSVTAGDEIKLVGSAASGLVRAWVLIERSPEQPANLPDMVEG